MVFDIRGILFCLLALVIQTAAVDNCYEFDDCAACTGPLGEALECVWCLDKSQKPVSAVTGAKPPLNAAGQCNTVCPVDTTLTPAETATLGYNKTTITTTKNDEFTLTEPFAGLNVTRVDIKLRRGSTATFPVALKKGPIAFSLYFLLDLSASMLSSKAAVELAAPMLPGVFNDDSPDVSPKPFKFGFGSFVDKTIPPFTYNRFAYSDAPTYGYKHEIDLATNGEEFKRRVGNIKLSGNNDEPEGGLDAVVQCLYCKDLVSWPPSDVPALRLVLFVTDQLSHVAGDAVEAGITWPAEMKCLNQFFFGNNRRFHPSQLMNPLEQGTKCDSGECWYHNLVHDYPSIEQIKGALEENSARIAFVVPAQDSNDEPGVRQQYEEFAKILGTQGILASNNLNEIRLNQKNFNDVVRKTYFTLFKLQPEFSITEADEFLQYFRVSSGCTPVDPGITVAVDFDTVQLLFDCTFSVTTIESALGIIPRKPVEAVMSSGLFGEFTLAVESSSCKCPKLNFFVGLQDLKCNGNGALKDENCGVCQCDPVTQATGEYCDCDLENAFRSCLEDANGLPCGGPNRGKCECGRCECLALPGKEPYSGPACECSNECGESDASKRCGGIEAGKCDCNTCKCNAPRFSGEKCECDENNCKDSAGEICGGKNQGKCVCNECECKPPYKGEFCEICDAEVGLSLDPPVLCGNDGICNQCSQNGNTGNPSTETWGCECCFSKTKLDYSKEESLCQWCHVSNQCVSRETINLFKEDNKPICSTRFTEVKEDNASFAVKVPIYDIWENIAQCPPPAPFDSTPVIVGTVLGVLALILLALLLWRLLTYLKDKKEWEQYEKDRAKSKWQADNNPIFKSSVSEFENPIFE